jgi:glycosyltransferase involved in cell wall biosynthesis
MRILLSSRHTYPAAAEESAGTQPIRFPSRSADHLHDLLARGLAEFGHTVFYLLPAGASRPLPPNVQLVSGNIKDIDIDVYHSNSGKEPVEGINAALEYRGIPWVTSCHLDVRLSGRTLDDVRSNWIFVSRSLAQSHGSNRYVLNGLDPADYRYVESKSDYLLFLSALDRWADKGLETALWGATRAGRRLVVAGTARKWEIIDQVKELCRQHGADYVGDVRGVRKAELLANAAALVVPSRLNEGLPLVLIEALMSGTPVLAGCAGGSQEIVTPETGFLCGSMEECCAGIAALPSIAPRACRERALARFHYRRMVENYIREYEIELASRRRRPV